MTRFTLDHLLFGARTGRGVRVAIIDSGLAPGHPHVGDVADGHSFVSTASDLRDRIGHGTAVAAAIREKAPDAELVPIKVFDRTLTTDATTLCDAIRWAADHDCRVVNLSLGTSNAAHTAPLDDVMRYAEERGVLVVAAFSSDAVRWFPGSLDGAIGVTGSADIARDEFGIVEDADTGRQHLVASIYPRPIPGVPRERNLHGISFAVANASGFLARLCECPSYALTRAKDVFALLNGAQTVETEVAHSALGHVIAPPRH